MSSGTALGSQTHTDGIFLGRLLTRNSAVEYGPFKGRPAATEGLSWAVSHTDQRIVVKNKKNLRDRQMPCIGSYKMCAKEDVHHIGMRQKLAQG